MFDELEKLMCFCNEKGFEYLIDDIIAEELINDWLSLQDLDWQSLARILYQIEWFDDEFYLIDGYGHLRNITYKDIEGLKYDLWQEVERSDNEELMQELDYLLNEEFEEVA